MASKGGKCDVCLKPGVAYPVMLILFLLGLGFIIQLFFVPEAIDKAFEDGIIDRVVMTQDQQDRNTENYRYWASNYYDDSPWQLFEFWLYNITNPYEVATEGANPSFDIVGPWVYNRYENKTNVMFDENDNETIVSYSYHYVFQFRPERSVNISRDEMVWTISGPMLGFFSFIDNLVGNETFDGSGLECVDEGIKNFPATAVFYHQPVYNFIHGIRDPFIDGICPGDFLFDLFRPDTFYRLAANGTNMIVEHTGKADRDKTRELRLYRNSTIPMTADKPVFGRGPLWTLHDELVEGGRETRQFPPLNTIKKDSELTIWSIEKFRKTQYTFQKEVNWKGVPLWRFRIDDSELQNCTRYYNNSCTLSPTTETPTSSPTTSMPTASPITASPTAPTESPTQPTLTPTASPTMEPISGEPTLEPTQEPTEPTLNPTDNPSMTPTQDTPSPTDPPTRSPTCEYEIGESETCKYFQNWQPGVFNLTNLRGPPSFVSKGRLLDAPFFIEDTVRRFNISLPDPDIDDQYFDIDPKSGIVFRNYHSYQLNFNFRRLIRPYATNFNNITIYDHLIPFAYVRVEGIATDENINDYADILSAMDTTKGLSLYGGPALAVVLFGLMFFLLCQTRRANKEAAGYGYVSDDPYGRLVESNNDIPESEMAKSGIGYGATAESPQTKV